MSYPRVEFDEASIIRWTKDAALCCQPMMDQAYSYRGQEFKSHNGYWVFNERNYSGLDQVKLAIDTYAKEIARQVEAAADS